MSEKKVKNKKEQLRIENFNMQREKLLKEGYKESEGVISVLKANLMAFVTAGPIALLVLIIYIIKWESGTGIFGLAECAAFIGMMFICIFIHEGLHGLTWSFFCKDKWKSINFGLMVKEMTPYCSCLEPLSFKAYIIGGLMPFFILGLGISAVGIMSQSLFITFLGVVNILAAGGDTTIACMLLKYRHAVIMDHPNKCGFVAFYK